MRPAAAAAVLPRPLQHVGRADARRAARGSRDPPILAQPRRLDVAPPKVNCLLREAAPSWQKLPKDEGVLCSLRAFGVGLVAAQASVSPALPMPGPSVCWVGLVAGGLGRADDRVRDRGELDAN